MLRLLLPTQFSNINRSTQYPLFVRTHTDSGVKQWSSNAERKHEPQSTTRPNANEHMNAVVCHRISLWSLHKNIINIVATHDVFILSFGLPPAFFRWMPGRIAHKSTTAKSKRTTRCDAMRQQQGKHLLAYYTAATSVMTTTTTAAVLIGIGMD